MPRPPLIPELFLWVSGKQTQQTSIANHSWSQRGHSERKSAMATIRKHRDKWQVMVRRKGYPQLSRVFRRKADALEWANHAEIEADLRGLPSDPRALERLTVSDLMKRYRENIVSGVSIFRYWNSECPVCPIQVPPFGVEQFSPSHSGLDRKRHQKLDQSITALPAPLPPAGPIHHSSGVCFSGCTLGF
jgi:hypothetical protein